MSDEAPVDVPVVPDFVEQCSCDAVLEDLVLPPYPAVLVSVLLLTGLSLAINMAELKWKDRTKTTKHLRQMTGTATLAALATPPWWFLMPQVLYHVLHAAYIGYSTFTRGDHEIFGKISIWASYELAYGRWINGGATVFCVFGIAGSLYTKAMIEGQRGLAEALADPRAEMTTDVDINNFRKRYLLAEGVQEMEEIRGENEEKLEVMGNDERWSKGMKTKMGLTLIPGICMLPAVATHVLPGFLAFAWVEATLCTVLHFICMKFVVPRQKRLGLIGRIVLLDCTLAFYAIVIMDAFNFSVLLYNGKRYLDIVPDIFLAHKPYCFFCSVLLDFHTALTAGSFI
ncbi:hypothetical protein DIPPA_09868 [Diplonema papillatum]|nr:hypothetical protein DIPPA_09868 [Diplonema papillatum]